MDDHEIHRNPAIALHGELLGGYGYTLVLGDERWVSASALEWLRDHRGLQSEVSLEFFKIQRVFLMVSVCCLDHFRLRKEIHSKIQSSPIAPPSRSNSSSSSTTIMRRQDIWTVPLRTSILIYMILLKRIPLEAFVIFV